MKPLPVDPNSIEALQEDEVAFADFLVDEGDIDGFRALKERLGISGRLEEVFGKPIFFAPSMRSTEWEYSHDVEGAYVDSSTPGIAEAYTSFQKINLALVREIRKSRELSFLYDQCDYVVLDCFKEGSIEGIYMVSFFKEGAKIEGVIQVGKSERQTRLVQEDAERLETLHKGGRVPKVYGSGSLELDGESVYYKLVQFLPSREISVHNVDGVREFHFLEGDEATNVPHDVMGNKMMEAVYETMFSNPDVQCVPEILRGDLVWMPDSTDPTDSSKGRVMLISTANVLTLLDHSYYQKLNAYIQRELGKIEQTALLDDVFYMVAAIDRRYDSGTTDENYRKFLKGESMDQESLDDHVVYPYSVFNLLHGLVTANLDERAFVQAATALFYALWIMTEGGKKTRTHPVLTEMSGLYNELQSVWQEVVSMEGDFSQNLKGALNAHRNTLS